MTTPDFVVRRGRPGDGPAMRAVLERLLVRRPEDLNGETGFLIGDIPAEGFEARLAGPNLIFVVEQEGKLAGYLLAYPREAFAPLVAPRREEDPAYAFILDESEPDAILLDQIGILPEFRRPGVARALHDAFSAAAASRPAWLDIVHAPVFNRRSEKFFRGLGYRLVREVPAARYTAGIYRRP